MFYHVHHKNLWGSYGKMLCEGFAFRDSDDPVKRFTDRDATLEIKRTGPFAPSITSVRGCIVVTDRCKSEMEKVAQLSFKPVKKKLIVASDWEDWDWDDGNPEEFPEDSDPANYVEGHSHSSRASNEMGPMWELCLQKGGLIWFTDQDKLIFKPSTWSGQELFWADSGLDNTTSQYVIATESGKDFLDAFDDDYLLEFSCCS